MTARRDHGLWLRCEQKGLLTADAVDMNFLVLLARIEKLERREAQRIAYEIGSDER